MRAVIQRVSSASVSIDDTIIADIKLGLLLLVGIESGDEVADATYLAQKIVGMRIFADEQGKMNTSLLDKQANCLVVSQFTLYADTAKGNRPSFMRAERPEVAIPVYEFFLLELQRLLQKKVPRGRFGADMQIALVNDGPVTIILDSKP
jgi:D-aminoacyl-tRNA deacylase